MSRRQKKYLRFHHKIEDSTIRGFLNIKTFRFSNRLKSPQQRSWITFSWRHIGGRPLLISTALNDIDIEKATWPQRKRNCFDLCELVLSDFHPSPSLCIWFSYRLAQWLLYNPKPVRRNATRDCPPYAGYVLKNSTRFMVPVLSSNSSVPRV